MLEVKNMRLIDADAFIRYIDCGHLRPPTETCFSELDVVRMIDKQPTVDAETARLAQFKKSIERDEWWGYIYVCSECGAEMMVYNAENDCVPPEYCANCGVRIDAETE